MTTLDYDTLQVASICSRLAFVGVFLVTLLRHPGETCFAVWAAALGCSLVASLMMQGDLASVSLSAHRGAFVYTLYGASLALSWAGLRLFYERPVIGGRILALAVAPGLFYGLLVTFGMPMTGSMSAVFVCIALSTGLCILEILRTPASARLWTQYIVLLGFSGYFLVFLLAIAAMQLGEIRPNPTESGIHALLFDQSCGVFLQVGYLAMMSERAQLKLQRLAETDPLTGLANRRGLFSTMARMSGPDRAFPRCAVLLTDIDHFKSVNDTYGHEAGDRVLVEFAQRLRAVMRRNDVVARWGGEEFLIVLDAADAPDAVGVAERLLGAVSGQPFTIDGLALKITASVGVSAPAAGEVRIDDALARADAALYAAKTGGRNRVCLTGPPVAPVSDETGSPNTATRLGAAVQAIQAGIQPQPDPA